MKKIELSVTVPVYVLCELSVTVLVYVFGELSVTVLVYVLGELKSRNYICSLSVYDFFLRIEVDNGNVKPIFPFKWFTSIFISLIGELVLITKTLIFHKHFICHKHFNNENVLESKLYEEYVIYVKHG